MPAAEGWNETLIIQLLPAGTLVPHVLAAEKSGGIEMFAIDKAAEPRLDNVIVWIVLVVPTFWLPKFKLVGESETTGAGGRAPVPASVTTCGLPTPESVIDREADSPPTKEGVNVMETVQVPPGTRLLGQRLLSPKSAAFGPLIEIDETAAARFPEFKRISV